MASTMVFSDTPPVRFPTNDPPNQNQLLDRGKCDKEASGEHVHEKLSQICRFNVLAMQWVRRCMLHRDLSLLNEKIEVGLAHSKHYNCLYHSISNIHGCTRTLILFPAAQRTTTPLSSMFKL